MPTGNGGTSVDIATAALPLGSGQITFPAVQNASAGANTLDDYAENTFTPGISFGGGTTGITYSLQAGKYAKIGRNIMVWGMVVLTSKGSSSGGAALTGLPKTAESAVANMDGGIQFIYYLNMGLAVVTWAAFVVPATTTATMVGTSAAGTSVATYTEANFTNTTQFMFFGMYGASA